MLFNSIAFACLVAVTFVLFYTRGLRRFQVAILVLASFAFYAWSEPWLLFLLMGSILANTWLSWFVSFALRDRIGTVFTIGIVINILCLFFFKYGPLVASTVGLRETSIGRMMIVLPLPIGISFYTFESISLLVDVFKARGKSGNPLINKSWRGHFLNTSLFLSFFPHLISGPILKAEDFYSQIQPKQLKDIAWEPIVKACILGFFLKMVVADNLKDSTSSLSYPLFLTLSPISLLALLLAYSIQIFSDFARYSLIAIGIAAVFGYRLPPNFNYPYLSKSLTEFWQRWHISLSSWLREYLYFPLGGNRKGRVRTYINLFIVMVLGGLWHGAAWSFALWGLYHGTGLALERWVRDCWPDLLERIPAVIRVSAVFSFVTFGWLFFKLTHLGELAAFFAAFRTNWESSISNQKALLANLALFSSPVVIYYLVQVSPILSGLKHRYESFLYGVLLAAIVISAGLPGAFIYFQF